jgi:hypothetical protein
MLGSLYYYRAIENPEIADKDEGKATYEIEITGPAIIKKKWLNVILQGIFSIDEGAEETQIAHGLLKPTIHKYQSTGEGKDNVRIEKLHATIERDSFNEFIYCMSLFETPPRDPKIFSGYDDYWTVELKHADAIGGIIARLIGKAIVEGRDSGKHVIDPLIDLETVDCLFRCDSVMYTSRKLEINEANNIEAEEFLSKIEDIAFIKPKKFESENEFRFSFIICSGNRILEIMPEHLILDSTEIRKLII